MPVTVRPRSAAFGTVDVHGELGPSVVAAERARRRCPACRPSGPWRPCARPSRIREILAADLESEGGRRRCSPPGQELVELLVAARRVRADDHARACPTAAGADRARFVRSSASGRPSAMSMRLMLPRLPLPPPGPIRRRLRRRRLAFDDHRLQLGHQLQGSSARAAPSDRVGALDPRAAWRARRCTFDLTFVGLRAELGRNRAHE